MNSEFERDIMVMRIFLIAALMGAFIVGGCVIEEEPTFIAGGWCEMEGITVCDDEMLTILVCNGELIWEPQEDCPNGCTMDTGTAECIGGEPDNAVDNDNQLPDTTDTADTADTAGGDTMVEVGEMDDVDIVDTTVDEDIIADDAAEVDDAAVADDAAEVDDAAVADDATEVDDATVVDDAAVADDAAVTDNDTVTDDTADDATVSDDDTGPTVVVTYDFNSDAQGWTHTAVDGYSGDTGWNYDFWQRGARTDGANCHEGAGCWGTNLAGNYINCQRAELRSPVIDLSAHAAQTVTLYAWQSRDFWDNGTYFDGGILEFSGDGGSTWVNGCPTCSGTVNTRGSSGGYSCNSSTSFYVDDEKGFVQTTSGWVSTYFTVPAGVLTANFRMRFVYSTGVSVLSYSDDPVDYSHKGWYLDDVSIEAQ